MTDSNVLMGVTIGALSMSLFSVGTGQIPPSSLGTIITLLGVLWGIRGGLRYVASRS